MEENIKILENCWVMTTDHVLDEGNQALKLAIKNLIKGYRKLEEEFKREKSWRIRVEQENEDICHEVNTKYVRKSIAVPKYEIEQLKKENEINIDKMRPYRHQGPFDFGVLNGIDECCRKLLEDKQ